MINNKGIFIKNIYYMLAYAFQVLKQENFESIASEEFEEIQDLFAAILAKGIAQQLKQGLYREYLSKEEDLLVLRGKLDVYGTIRNQMQHKKMLSCDYDELSVDNIYNQILKTTATILIRHFAVRTEQKRELKKVLLFFDEVSVLDPSRIRWNTLLYQRNNKNYEMLMNLCFFILDGMLQTTEKGIYKMKEFSDEHMDRLYEKFVLEYFKRHHSYLSDVRAAKIDWNVDEGTDNNMIRYLPEMKTDVFLRKDDKILIIDTKFYGKTMQQRFDKWSFHSGNLYQIMAYVENVDKTGSDNVSGMLLYAKTDEDITPDGSSVINHHMFSVKTLDLNQDFTHIAKQLDAIAEKHFGKMVDINYYTLYGNYVLE